MAKPTTEKDPIEDRISKLTQDLDMIDEETMKLVLQEELANARQKKKERASRITKYISSQLETAIEILQRLRNAERDALHNVKALDNLYKGFIAGEYAGNVVHLRTEAEKLRASNKLQLEIPS